MSQNVYERLFDVRGTRIVVTGSAAGLGFAMAEVLAECGARLTLADVAERRLEASTETLRSRGFDVRSFVVDVSDEDRVQARARERPLPLWEPVGGHAVDRRGRDVGVRGRAVAVHANEGAVRDDCVTRTRAMPPIARSSCLGLRPLARRNGALTPRTRAVVAERGARTPGSRKDQRDEARNVAGIA